VNEGLGAYFRQQMLNVYEYLNYLHCETMDFNSIWEKLKWSYDAGKPNNVQGLEDFF